jgi:hypothetical protein
MSVDEHARRAREQRITSQRPHQLDKLVTYIRSELADDAERLYVIDQLRAPGVRGRPA